jgi:hypothetical protein
MSRLEEVKNRIKNINQQTDILYQELSDLESELLSLKFKEMISSGALTESFWRTKYQFGGLVLYSNDHSHQKLAQLFEINYHCSNNFDGWRLYINEGEISIVFEDFDKGLSFIKENNIKIDLKNINDRLKEANKVVKDITTFVEKLGK